MIADSGTWRLAASTKETDTEFCTASGKRELGDWRDESSVLSDNAD